MARLLPPPVRMVGGLRAALAEHLRDALASRHYRDPRTERLVERLDAGEPVEISGWQIRRWHPRYRHVPLVRIDPDGSVTPVQPRARKPIAQ